MDDELDLENPPFPLTAIDREVLATRDEDYHCVTWDELRQIVADNRLEQLKRLPSDLHKYLRWSHDTKKRYGSMNNFVVQKRLHWSPKDPAAPISATSFSHFSEEPFADDRDYVVLLNDWPYAFEPGIKHLLVWTKTPIAVDDGRGDVTPQSRRLIEDFVDRFFVQNLARSAQVTPEDARARVIWFKNWVSLQSVRGVDHVHILVKDAPEALLQKWLER